MLHSQKRLISEKGLFQNLISGMQFSDMRKIVTHSKKKCNPTYSFKLLLYSNSMKPPGFSAKRHFYKKNIIVKFSHSF
jgi:hypothetical protein